MPARLVPYTWPRHLDAPLCCANTLVFTVDDVSAAPSAGLNSKSPSLRAVVATSDLHHCTRMLRLASVACAAASAAALNNGLGRTPQMGYNS